MYEKNGEKFGCLGKRSYFCKCFYSTYKNIKDYEENNFSFCSSLEKIKIPKTIKQIPSNFLWGCTSLKSFTLPESIIEIEGNPFRESGIEYIDCRSEHFLFEHGLLMRVDNFIFPCTYMYKHSILIISFFKLFTYILS